MSVQVLRFAIAAVCAAGLLLPLPAGAQGSAPKDGDKPTPVAPTDATKKPDEFAEAARVLPGPAANPECVWLGRRVVNLLWRDDLDTAFRHLDMYDRFGCPGAHVQATFRCLVRQGGLDPKAADILNARVHDCWLNPDLQPVAAEVPAADKSGAKPSTAK